MTSLALLIGAAGLAASLITLRIGIAIGTHIARTREHSEAEGVQA